MKIDESLKILKSHKKHLDELIKEGSEYYYYAKVVEAINCILDEMSKDIVFGIKGFTTDELVKEITEREGALTLKKQVNLNFPILDNTCIKSYRLRDWIELIEDKSKENSVLNNLYELLRDIREDYSKINNFYNNGAVG